MDGEVGVADGSGCTENETRLFRLLAVFIGECWEAQVLGHGNNKVPRVLSKVKSINLLPDMWEMKGPGVVFIGSFFGSYRRFVQLHLKSFHQISD